MSKVGLYIKLIVACLQSSIRFYRLELDQNYVKLSAHLTTSLLGTPFLMIAQIILFFCFFFLSIICFFFFLLIVILCFILGF